MKVTRIAQNFRGRLAHILTGDQRAAATLACSLQRLGVEPLPAQIVVTGPVIPLPEGLRPLTDILFMDGDLNLPPTWPDGTTEAPCPVVGLVGSEAPSRLRGLLQLGAAAFVPKPVSAGVVFSSLFLAVNMHNRNAALLAEVEDQHARRRDRVHVIRAVGQLVRRDGVSEDEAYATLRREAMRTRSSIEEFCRSIVQSDPPGGGPPAVSKKKWRA